MYGWRKIPNGGWLEGRPAYESPDGRYWVAEDWDDLDDDTQKRMWYLHDETGFVGAFPTLREAINHVQ